MDKLRNEREHYLAHPEEYCTLAEVKAEVNERIRRREAGEYIRIEPRDPMWP